MTVKSHRVVFLYLIFSTILIGKRVPQLSITVNQVWGLQFYNALHRGGT